MSEVPLWVLLFTASFMGEGLGLHTVNPKPRWLGETGALEVYGSIWLKAQLI